MVLTTIALSETKDPIEEAFKARIGASFDFELGPGIIVKSLEFIKRKQLSY